MKTIKKFLSIISIFSVFLLNFSPIFLNYSNASSSLNNFQNIENTWITSKQLIKITLNKWFTSYWIKTFLDIRKVTIQDIRNLRKKTLKEKIAFIKKLFWTWLTKQEIEKIKKNNWFSKIWINLLNNFSNQNNFNNNYSKSNFSISKNNSNFILWKNFIKPSFLKQEKTWIFKVNYVDIIPWKNAWVVQANFVWTNSFPQKIILDKWFSFEISQKNLDKNLIKSKNLLTKIDTLKKQNIDFWKINISKPELSILPDRLKYKKQINIKFTNKKQFENINKYLWEYFNPNKITSNTNLAQLKNNNFVKVSWNTKNLDYSFKHFEENLVKSCLEKTNDSQKCKNLDLSKLEKTISFNESMDYSLIPTTIEDIENNNIFINKNPKYINISKKDIFKRFDLLRQIRLKKDFGLLKNAEINWEIPKHNMNDPKYCDTYYSWELQSAKVKKDNSLKNKVLEKIKKCKNLQEEVNKVTKASYKQNLLNWFTLWESKSYSWGTEISVDTYVAWTIKIFEFNFNFYYLYWIWIRIPIIAEAEVKDSIVHDYETEKQKAKVDFETKIKLKTIDADADYYKNVGLPDKHIFNWQELVLKFKSWIKFHVWTPITSNIDYEIKLTSLLVEKIKAWLIKMGLSEEKIQEFKDKNEIDLSRDFIPPFAWNNSLNLLTLESNPIILFSIYWIDLLWKIWLKVDIDWRITSKCEEVNAKWWCPSWDVSNNNWVDVWASETAINVWYDSSRIHFDTDNYYIWNWKAYFNWNQAIQDELSAYSNFWVKFSDFKYHPILLLTLYAFVWVWIPDIPYIWDLVVWSPEIDIYKLKFSSDELYLWTHSWTNWVFDISTKNKIYSTASTLKEISYIWVKRIENKITPRSELIIKPESNTINWNSVFYRTDWQYPRCEANSQTDIYMPYSRLYKQAKDELVNQKLVNIKAIACDMFNKDDPRARKTYKKPVLFQVKNYYHKPVIAEVTINSCVDPLNSNWDKSYKNYVSNWNEYTANYFDNNSTKLSQEEIENLNFVVPRNNPVQTNFIKIISHPETKPYIIKYSFTDKYPKTNNLKFNLSTTKTTITNNIISTNSDICNSDSWKNYSWEIFVAWEQNSPITNIPDNYNSNDIKDKIVYYNTDKILKAVKCIKKADWTYFQSLMTTVNIQLKDTTSWWCPSSSAINKWAWEVNINNKMKNNIIDPIFNIQNKLNIQNNFNSQNNFNKNFNY